jgi:1-acyl-sn-glycerol-3-phosphate acyltransferase
MILICFIRSLLASLIYPFYVLFCCLLALANLLIGTKNSENSIVQFWAHYTLKMFGVEVLEFGKKNLPKTGCLFLFNHTSFFDVFVMHAKLRGVRFGAKIELFKIPIFGKTMLKIGVLPIARDQRAEVIRVYEKAQERAKNGEQFALSPEGGRSSDSQHLRPFKSGPFIFAIRAQIPIVPVVIKGASEVLPKGHWLPNLTQWKRVIEVHYLEKVEVSEFKIEQRAQLSALVRGQMEQVLLQRPAVDVVLQPAPSS